MMEPQRALLALPVVTIDIDAIHKRGSADSEQVRLLKRAVARYARTKAEWWHVLPAPIKPKA